MKCLYSWFSSLLLYSFIYALPLPPSFFPMYSACFVSKVLFGFLHYHFPHPLLPFVVSPCHGFEMSYRPTSFRDLNTKGASVHSAALFQ
jgi:hypothetical protein